ncbi:hypothetical protein ACFOET_06885 [Parapedobacter deserti]|uniref:Prepilin type IV endopeptidase peptidase domain-containing protein n=1 Tax=Parapedobacter deserti TaxID=1912957 RepID=A0ABV7JJP2_9SPHI
MLLWAIVIVVLAAVVWQDFKNRAVYVWIFPLLAGLAVIQSVMLGVFSLAATAANLAIIVLQLCLLNLLMYTRTKKWLMHGEQWIGWGDIAFFAVLACCFSTVNFVIFHVLSLLIILVGALVAMAFGRFSVHIPLAGGQAALLGLLLLADYGQWGRRLYIDLDMLGFVQ